MDLCRRFPRIEREKVKEIKLTQGKVAFVDDEDFEKLNKYKWCFHKQKKTGYAERCVRIGKRVDNKVLVVRMHREIVKAPKGLEVDHKDRNGLNNQKSNLRIVTHSQNQMNKCLQRNNKSGYKGVSWDKKLQKWLVRIVVMDKRVVLGYCDTAKEGVLIYNESVKRHYGEFARLNEIF